MLLSFSIHRLMEYRMISIQAEFITGYLFALSIRQLGRLKSFKYFIFNFTYYNDFNVFLISIIATMAAMTSEIGKDTQIPVAPMNLDNSKDNGIIITN